MTVNTGAGRIPQGVAVPRPTRFAIPRPEARRLGRHGPGRSPAWSRPPPGHDSTCTGWDIGGTSAHQMFQTTLTIMKNRVRSLYVWCTYGIFAPQQPQAVDRHRNPLGGKVCSGENIGG